MAQFFNREEWDHVSVVGRRTRHSKRELRREFAGGVQIRFRDPATIGGSHLTDALGFSLLP